MKIYEDVIYRILNETKIHLKIGDIVSDLCLYNSAFITAANPNGVVQDNQTNVQLNNTLENYIIDNNFDYYYGYGYLGDWSEESFLIKHINFDSSVELSKKFNQVAFVYINNSGVVELHYT